MALDARERAINTFTHDPEVSMVWVRAKPCVKRNSW